MKHAKICIIKVLTSLSIGISLLIFHQAHTNNIPINTLLWINHSIHLLPSYQTQNCQAIKTSESIYCNNVYNDTTPSKQEVHNMLHYFKTTPFMWFVQENDLDTQMLLLEQNCTLYSASIEAMYADLQNVPTIIYPNNLVIKKINDLSSTDLLVWCTISSQARLNQISKEAIIQHLQTLYLLAGNAIQLYIGYIEQQAVCTAMIILHETYITCHWISTLPKYARQGLATAIMHYALCDAKKSNYQAAMLLTRAKHLHFYKHLGFNSCNTFHIYTK